MEEIGCYLETLSIKSYYFSSKQVDYVRTGLTRLFSATQYSVRPLRHDQVQIQSTPDAGHFTNITHNI